MDIENCIKLSICHVASYKTVKSNEFFYNSVQYFVSQQDAIYKLRFHGIKNI